MTDGRTLQSIPMSLAGRYGSATERGTRWAATTLEAEDAIERRYGPDVTLFAARSFDAKQLYHHPELAVAYGSSYSSSGVRPRRVPAAVPDPLAQWDGCLGDVRPRGTASDYVTDPSVSNCGARSPRWSAAAADDAVLRAWAPPGSG